MKNQEVLTKFFEAENKRDWVNYPFFLHPEIMWFLHTETTHMPVSGREEYMDRIHAGYDADPNASFVCESMEVSPSGNRIVATIRNSNGGRSVNIYDFENGMIRWEYEYTLE